MRTPLLHHSLLILLAIGLASCATPPGNVARTKSHALGDTSGTALARGVRKEIARNGSPGESGVRLLISGQDALVARMELAEKSERSIDAQYYIWNNDLSGRLLTDQLLKAADRGVRVRLLIDDMVLVGRDANGAILDQHPNIELRLFNPFRRGTWRALQMLTRFGSITRRMHNKSFTVDGHISILGGRNIGDEYFGANPDLDYGDLDALVVGPVVKEMETSFDSYWNNALAYPMAALHHEVPDRAEVSKGRAKLAAVIDTPEADRYRQALETSELAVDVLAGRVDFEWAPARIIDDEPEKISADRSASELHLRTKLKPYFDRTERELVIISPYFVPTRKGTDYLCDMARRGVRVRILTNSLASTDVPAVHSGYGKYRKGLVAAGVELYEVDSVTRKLGGRDVKWLGGASKTSLHAKSFVFDRKEIFIGSYNLDPRSAKENTEVGLIVESPVIATEIASIFDQRLTPGAFRLDLSDGRLEWHQIKNGEARIYHTDPHTTFFQRFKTRVIGWLPIESQL